MGRIQRKKDSNKKKKQRQIDIDDSGKASVNSGVVAMKKPLPSSKKSTGFIKSKVAKQEAGFIQKSIQFLREVKIELKKVTWPSRKQTMGSTVVVLILVMIISFFLGLVDFGLSSLIQVVLP